MSNSNGKITRPVSFADVQKVLGRSFSDEGKLCTSDNINRWSKSKPYDYPSLSPLVDAEKKGTPAQNGRGIFYGLKVASSNLFDLHNAKYEYVGRPNGGAFSPYRISDFNGYDDKAVPTINGVIPDRAFYNVAKNLMCTITYDYEHHNTTGVDIAEIIKSAEMTTFESYYPCILVGRYARGLFNSATDTQTSIKYGSAWYQNFYCDFDGYPGISAGVKTCTVFFIKQLYIPGVLDLRSWQSVSGILSEVPGYTVPNAVAVECDLKDYDAFPKVKVTGLVSYDSEGFTLRMKITNITQFETPYTIKFSDPNQWSVDFVHYRGMAPTGGGGGVNDTIGGTGNPTLPPLETEAEENRTLKWTDIGLLQAPTLPFTIAGDVLSEGFITDHFWFYES